VGLLDWFWRRGSSGAPSDTGGEPDSDRPQGEGVPAGSPSEGSPVGMSDPGSITGEDADEVVAADEDDAPAG
jgi:hypothetical protein